MDINDILAAPTGIKRPDHPDFWRLSEVMLAQKADKESMGRGEIDAAEFERRWRAHVASVGDFDSIAYSAIQVAFSLHNIKTGEDWMRLTRDSRRHLTYVQTVQAFFDGFILGAQLERRRHSEDQEK